MCNASLLHLYFNVWINAAYTPLFLFSIFLLWKLWHRDMDITSHVHAHKARREKSQWCRSESFEEKEAKRGRCEENCSYIGAKRKSRKAVICPLIVIYCDPRAGGRPDICMRNWRWHKGMNLLTHDRTHEQENGVCLTQLYVEQWSGIGRVCVGALTRTIYTSSCPWKIGRASERSAVKKRGSPSFPSPSPPPFLPSIRCFARHSRPRTRQIEGVSRGGI